MAVFKTQNRRKPGRFSRFCNAGGSRFLIDPKDVNPAAESRVKAFAPCTRMVLQAFPSFSLPD
ncbi:hypothetical protein [uncultured Roseibium sp.]|uniref:hypothetical protein n=1 Tax=uncultured Roseibium sp. TaxID=1936171 RepID=UPI003748B887